MEMFNPTEKLELLAASASEVHASERSKLSSKIRVEFKSDEDRTRKRQLSRLLKNRQSAALSRQRKKEYITDLELRTNGLISENHDLTQKVTKLSSINVEFKMHIESLEKRLSDAKNENTDLRSRIAPDSQAETNASLTTTTTTEAPKQGPSRIDQKGPEADDNRTRTQQQTSGTNNTPQHLTQDINP